MPNDEARTPTPQRVLEISLALRPHLSRVYSTQELMQAADDLCQLAAQLERTEANEFNAIWVINKHLAGTDEVSTFNDAMEIVRKAGRQLERNAEALEAAKALPELLRRMAFGSSPGYELACRDIAVIIEHRVLAALGEGQR